MESESPSIDPRYRPEFQRGYSRGAAPVPVVPTSRAEEPAQVGLPPVTRSDAEPARVTDAAIESAPVPRRHNPYLLVIPLVGVSSIALGGWLTVSQWITNFGNQSDSTVEGRFSQGLIFIFASPLITVGLASLLGLGFWLAVRRRP